MKYKEATNLSRGQIYAKALPLKGLPQAVPDPNQDAILWCQAPTEPRIANSYRKYPKDQSQVELFITHVFNIDRECVKEVPACDDCHISSAVAKNKSGLVTITREQLQKRDLSQFKPKL